MTPADAQVYLEGQGFTISWRRETTTETGTVAEITDEMPDGVITDVIPEGDEAIVFVTPPDDPLLEQFPVGHACPTG